MTIVEALRALVGNPKLLATLPGERGSVPAVVATSGNRFLDVRSGKPRTYVPKLSDYCSIQWEVIDMSIPRQPGKAA
jgi:hypothetical protein